MKRFLRMIRAISPRSRSKVDRLDQLDLELFHVGSRDTETKSPEDLGLDTEIQNLYLRETDREAMRPEDRDAE